MTRRAIALAAVLVACGGSKKPASTEVTTPVPVLPADKILAMLPPGPQLVLELDLARLRANPVIGAVVTRALEGPIALPGAAPVPERGDGATPPPSPLAKAEVVVLAAYGVGTAQAATLTLLASPVPIAEATRVAEGIYVLGPEDWTAQIAQRAALFEATGQIRAQPELLALRDRAMPAKAPGASLRITARLSFDARVALARQVGLESAPAQLSIWGDVVDDLAIIVDADSSDPGERRGKQAVRRLEVAIRGALTSLAGEPAARLLGVANSLGAAKLVARGTWIRAIIAIGPSHLQRVAQRADALLPKATP